MFHFVSLRERLASSQAVRTLLLWSATGVIGVLAVVFAAGADLAIHYTEIWSRYAWWMPLVVCPLGLIVVRWLTRFVPETSGSGIPQTLAALETRDPGLGAKLLSIPVGLGKIVLTCLAMLAGGSVGREGPTIHVGASIMKGVSRLLGVADARFERGLITAGAAAGVAAAFNAPLTGIIFAIEELNRDSQQRIRGDLLMAVVVAGLVATYLHGNYRYFGVHSFSLARSDMLPMLLTSILAGLAGGLFSRVLLFGVRRLAPFTARYPYRVAGACGLVLAVLALTTGNLTFGTGYAQAEALLSGDPSLQLWYAPAKMLATLVSYFSGVPGGFFAPSLAVGAGIGGQMASFFPDTAAGGLVMLGMVAYFAGVTQAPLTAFVIVMEMTDSSDMLLPLMLAAIIGRGAARLVCRDLLYHRLAQPFLGRGQHGKPSHEEIIEKSG